MHHSLTAQALFFAFCGGILPAVFWLWFWLKEDTLHPEPRGLIMLAFFAGMVSALFSLPFEKLVASYSFPLATTILLWAFIEEFFKFGSAYITTLKRKDNDEPIDALVYLITAALGFAALENTFFLLQPILSGNVLESILTGNLRFVGASLLHVVASAMIGLLLALSFYRSPAVKRIYAAIGLLFALVLHTLFNFFIIQGNNTFIVFATVWLTIILLMVCFEKVKKINPIG